MDFDPMFKLCSKIMHRTALSMASKTMTDSLNEAVPLLARSAPSDFLPIYVERSLTRFRHSRKRHTVR